LNLIHNIQNFQSDHKTVVSVGSFDGVHIGHQKLIEQLNSVAEKHNASSVVISFTPHPRIFFNPETELRLLTTDDEKTELLSQTGLEYFILQDFDSDFARQLPETFIKLLTEKLNMKHLFIGYDHHFGKDRSGNFEFIKSLQSKYDFRVHRIDAVTKDGVNISSTLIRRALTNGDILLANSYLGYHYFITGKVVTGNRLGRKLGFPTANISVDNFYKLIPKQGVYVVYTYFDNQKIYGMMNIGFRPTISGKKQIKEVHFFDFQQDIYGKEIKVYFIDRLRDEQKFPSLDALKEQLKNDEIRARKYFE
jgi:riboflavin kinase/FMN adenylyltransferase